MATEGFRIRLHQSLVMPILLAGVPRTFAILNATFCAAFVLGLHAFYILPVSLALHIAAVLMAKHDPYFFEVIQRHLRKKVFYDV